MAAGIAIGCAPQPIVPRQDAPEFALGPSVAARRSMPRRAEAAPNPVDPRVAWRFDAGSALSGPPAIDPLGRVVIATAEGYLHVLGPTGGFQWSFTLLGSIAGAPAVDPSGRIFVATAAGRLYALNGTGHELWMFRSTAPVLTGVAVDRRGAYFAGSDRRLYAVAHRAFAIWGLKLDSFVTSGPIVLANGDVVIGTEMADVRVVRRGRPAHATQLPSPVIAPLAARSDGSLFALAGTTLYAFGPDYEPRWTFAPARAFAISDTGEVALEGNEIVWLDDEGAVLHRYAVEKPLGPTLALDGAGRAYAVTRSGELQVIERAGKVRRIELGLPRVRFVVLDLARARVIAGSSDGWVVAVRVDSR